MTQYQLLTVLAAIYTAQTLPRWMCVLVGAAFAIGALAHVFAGSA